MNKLPFKLFKLLLLLLLIFINICFAEYSSIININNQGLLIREGEIGIQRTNRTYVVVIINNSDQEYNDLILKCSTKCEMSEIQITGITKNNDYLILSNLPIGKTYTFFYTYFDSVHWKFI